MLPRTIWHSDDHPAQWCALLSHESPDVETDGETMTLFNRLIMNSFLLVGAARAISITLALISQTAGDERQGLDPRTKKDRSSPKDSVYDRLCVGAGPAGFEGRGEP